MISRSYWPRKAAARLGRGADGKVVNKEADAGMQKAVSPPAHETVYRALRSQILFGDLAPGDAVTIQGLAEALDAGMTPVREAIRRLISDGALRFQGNRRVRVPVLTKADLDEIAFLRKSVESQLARHASRRVSVALITDLTEIDTALDTAIKHGDVGGYLGHNYQFHMVLYEAAEAPILLSVTDRLWLRFGPSMRVVCGRAGTQSLPDRHKELLAALRADDQDAAAKAIEDDIDQGMQQMIQVLHEMA